ncbi:MAG TPA: class I SAM-dependent methyltransferase [Thermomicrobiales bacterium]|nr:class I SAM-dependent methyltransferase [Thermomicrobiales bacterium]
MLPDAREYGPWLDQFADDLRPGIVALDLGCGVGDDAHFLAGRGLAVVGVELSRERIARAAPHVPEACFVRASLSAPLPLRDRAVDMVVASLSLHYFDRPTTEGIAREIARVLRPGGVLLTRVNAVGDVASGYGAGVEREPDLFEVEPGYLKRFFTEESLRALLELRFEIAAISRQRTHGSEGLPKQTIVARAVSRG